jgi:predicted ATPase/DNA-binding SARP family transcriptional activator
MSPQEAALSEIALCLFGPFDVRIHAEPPAHLRTRKGQWLLALLTLRHDRDVERAWLAGTLWPDVFEEQALSYLRQSLTNLRTALGSQVYRLTSPTLHTLRFEISEDEADVLAFDAAIARGEGADLERAVSLYRGPLLEGCLEEWALPEREARARAYLHALETLADLCLTERDFARAQRYLRLVVSADPLQETSQRALIQALALDGDFAAATQVYRDLRLYLHRELNAAPDPETTALYQRLRQEASLRAQAPPAPPLLHEVHPAPPPRALPHPLSRLVGRRKEIDEIKACLARTRLVTLTGSGGVGKTRLALQVAEDLAAEYPDGAWFVDLAPLTGPDLVAQTLCSVLDLHAASGAAPQETLLGSLRSKSLLLVLDNCEHLITECARLADTLLQTCPGLAILATSREPLNIPGEQPWRVPSLAAPDTQLLRLPEKEIVAILAEYDAVRLFVERAAQQSPAFTLTRDNAPDVAQICRQLDGIPLAIELAAVRVRTLTVAQIASRLEDRFHLLTAGARTALPRHQTLRALMDWSYDLLSEQEQTLLRRLSVFAGDWTLEAAEAVCAGQGREGREACPERSEWKGREGSPLFPLPSSLFPDEVLDLLSSLVDKSLVVYEEQQRQARYRLLETTRQYAWQRLTAQGEARLWKDRHADYFLALAEQAQTPLAGSEQAQWLDRLQAAYDNLRAALDWLTEAPSGGSEERGLRLAGALVGLWTIRYYGDESPRWLEKALARGTARTLARAAALVGLGRLRPSWVGPEPRHPYLEAGLHIYEELGDHHGIAETLYHLSFALSRQGDLGRAQDLLERSLSLYRQAGDNRGVAAALHLVGSITFRQGDYVGASELLERSLEIAQEIGHQHSITGPLNDLGILAYARGDYAAARRYHEACLAANRALDSRAGIAWSLCNLGETALSAGDPVEAQAFFVESLVLFVQLEHPLGVPECVRGLALAAGAQCDRLPQAQRAALLLGAAEILRETLGASIPRYNLPEYERHVADVRSALSEEAFAALWAQGRALTLEQATSYALHDTHAV